MLLATLGDAIGYKRGTWEFDLSGPHIHKQMLKLTDNLGPLHL
jgi:hypothetical protein